MSDPSPSPSNKVLLFVSKNSLYFQATVDEFAKIIEVLQQGGPYKSEVIDVMEHPELAEEYKVDALPTLIIGDTRFIGKPEADQVLEYVKRKNAENV
jgi:protein-disulfide isomerase